MLFSNKDIYVHLAKRQTMNSNFGKQLEGGSITFARIKRINRRTRLTLRYQNVALNFENHADSSCDNV